MAAGGSQGEELARYAPLRNKTQGGLTAATKQGSARPRGSLPKGCNKMRPYRSATAPGLGMPFIERQQGIPIDPPDSPHSHGGQVKGCPWG